MTIPQEVSADALALADMLVATPVGETATLAAMSQHIGRDVSRCRHVLYTAIRIAQREHGAVFTSVRGSGYRRLSAERVAETVGTHARATIRRRARRARAALMAATSQANDLPDKVQARATQEISALGLLEYLAQDSTVRAAPAPEAKPEPVAITARRLLGIAP